MTDAGLDFRSILLSFKVISLAIVLVFVIGLMLSYLLTQYQFRGKKIFETLLTLPLILPPTVLGYYLLLVFGRHGTVGQIIFYITGSYITFTWTAAVLASFLVSLPLMIRTSNAAIEQVNKNLIHTSYLLGHSKSKTFIKVILPLAKHGLYAGVILSLARGLGEFGATLMLAGNIPGKTTTMPLEIYNLTASGDFSNANILAVILTLSSLLFLYLSDFFMRRRQ